MHLKRNQASKKWPIPRKGTTYVAVPLHHKYDSIPIVIVLRDLLNIGKSKKEIKKILLENKIKVNGKIIKNENSPLLIYDILSVGEKSYKLDLENKKYKLVDSKDKTKTSKVIGKKILSGKKTQINLNDGRNIITNEKIRTNDSLEINFDGKIVKVIPLKEGANAVIIKGKHIGEDAEIIKIDENKKEAEVKFGDKKINIKLEDLMVK
jgi:small subunit ribosomal protein S4e